MCLAVISTHTEHASAQRVERWNDDRVLELVSRAREARRSVSVDSAFQSYKADARGYVYFFIDRPDSDERTLVKADQVALEVYWRAPSTTRQRIVGLRDEKVLPTNIRYHLDHLTVVQDDFGDFIRLGDGDEVGAVLHPVGPASEAHYDFLLSDSLSIIYGGGAEEVRVYEVQVRPKVHSAPGFIGSVYLDRANAAIVRMTFTFTPASYVDPYLDYIRISLDNSLWDGRYWLPYRQEAELRRELPALDFLAGSIIRGRFEIHGYEFNEPLPRTVLTSRRVTAVPEAQRREFPFEQGLFAEIEEEGLAPSPTMEEIREQARRMVSQRYLSGLAPVRLHVASASDVLRYNRAEGLFVGAGVGLRPTGDVIARASGGWAVARGEPSLALSFTGESGRVLPELRAHWNDPRDLGQTPGGSRVVNTLGASLGFQDYLDPYFSRGLSLALTGPGQRSPVLTMRMERHESGRDEVSERPGIDERPVRSIDEGVLGAIDVEVPIRLPSGGEARLLGTLGRLGPETFGSALASARWTVASMDEEWRVELSGAVGAVSSGAPVQSLFLLGGRETLPGHAYRSLVGNRFWLAGAEATVPLLTPWLSARFFGAVGGTDLDRGRTLPPDWLPREGTRASVGLGLSAGWDVLRLDLGRGLGGGGDWELIFSVTPRFRAWL